MKSEYFEKMYVGIQNRDEYGDKVRLGFMCPDGDDAAAKKRKNTVDHWSRSVDTETHDNVPMTGFSLGRSVNRYRTNNKMFRVGDPRGFDLEISAANLAELISTTTIVKGVIQDELVWMRSGAVNELVTTDDESYLKRSQSYTAKVGDYIRLYSSGHGSNCQYIGPHYVVELWQESQRECTNDWRRMWHYVHSYHLRVDPKPYEITLPINYDKKYSFWEKPAGRRKMPPAKNIEQFRDKVTNVAPLPDDWTEMSTHTNGYGYLYRIFKTKEEAQAFYDTIKCEDAEALFKAAKEKAKA